jgi:hypothetical protein
MFHQENYYPKMSENRFFNGYGKEFALWIFLELGG